MKILPFLCALLFLTGCATPSFQLASNPSTVPSSISIHEDFSFNWRPPIGTPEFKTWISAGVYERYAQVDDIVYYKKAGDSVSRMALGIDPKTKSGGFAYNLNNGKVHVWESDVSIEGPMPIGPFIAFGKGGREIFSYIGFIPPELGEKLTLHFDPHPASDSRAQAH